MLKKFGVLLKKFGVVLAALFVLSLGVGSAEAAKIKLGVDGGPHEEIGELVQKLAAEKGLEVELVRFADFILPNTALADGDIDVNSFQHLPYLEAMMKDRGYKMVSIGSTVLMPMGAYSKTLKSVDELKDGMTVAIPNDPSNRGRALLLLQDRGLLKVNPDAKLLPTVLNVTENPHGLKFELKNLKNDMKTDEINDAYKKLYKRDDVQKMIDSIIVFVDLYVRQFAINQI